MVAAADVDRHKNGPYVHPNTFHLGISLRDYFAAQALAAVVSYWGVSSSDEAEKASRLVAKAYEIADAMMAARSR